MVEAAAFQRLRGAALLFGEVLRVEVGGSGGSGSPEPSWYQ